VEREEWVTPTIGHREGNIELRRDLMLLFVNYILFLKPLEYNIDPFVKKKKKYFAR
jgi:hypothetical protein